MNLVTTVADVVLQLTLMLPYTQQYTADVQQWHEAGAATNTAVVQAGGTELGMTIGTAFYYAASAFFIVFSLVQLAILLRPSVRAAFERQKD